MDSGARTRHPRRRVRTGYGEPALRAGRSPCFQDGRRPTGELSGNPHPPVSPDAREISRWAARSQGVSEKETHPPRINCVLICGGVWHDMDFARLELLKLLAEDQRVRTRVFENYETLDALREADILITYTCDVTPSLTAPELLRGWLANGGTWYDLHRPNHAP